MSPRNSSRAALAVTLGTAAVLSLALAIGVGGCGSGGGSSTGSGSTGSTTAGGSSGTASKPPAEGAGTPAASKARAPRARRLRHSFPPPRTEGMEPETVSALEAGEAACAGKTPTAVKEAFLAEGKERLDPGQLKMVGQIGRFEAKGAGDSSFIAGQLAADVYAATLPEGASRAGYQGCIYALAQGVEQHPAAKKKN